MKTIMENVIEAKMENKMENQQITLNRELYDQADAHTPKYIARPGLSEEVVRLISSSKNEPVWILQKRLQGLQLFQQTLLPSWGPDLSKLDFGKIVFFVDPNAKETDNWENVPEEIKKTFDRLGIPEAEKKALAGVGAQYDSSVVYHSLLQSLKDKGVIFENMDVAVQKYPELVKKYFMTSCIPVNDHKFIMLHAAVWSGGTFIYVPKNVKVDLPLQAYFRMNEQRGGQFEHTLIVIDEGAELHYIEGCFTKGNAVVTNPDYKPIEEIKTGDKVLTHDGTYKKVKEFYERPYTGTLKKIKIKGDGINTIEVTDDHPFLYVDKLKKRDRNREWNIRWNVPKFFKKNDYLAMPINKTIKSEDYHEFEIKEYFGKRQGFKNVKRKIPSAKGFFKLAGYYLAEGSISSGSYLNFSFGSHERNYIEEVKELLKEVFGIEKTLVFTHKKNHGTSVVVCSVELCRIFEIFGKQASKKEIPHWMMLEDPKKQKELIKAYFCGDGNYYNKTPKKALKELFRINSVSKKLIVQCRDILLRLGIVAFINQRDRSKEGRQTMYTLGITGDHMGKFGKIVGREVKMQLGRNKRGSRFGINENFAFFPIRELESREVQEEFVYNFSVEDNETYCINGVAAHNCSSPRYSSTSLHAGCVEIFVGNGAKMRYSSIENWSKNVYNLNTKRALVDKDATMEWVSGNMGSCTTMLYPCSILRGEGAKADNFSIVFAGKDQHQDVGAKAIHVAPHTSSTIVSRSISKDGGISSYRGLVKIMPQARGSTTSVVCDALILDENSRSYTDPILKIENNDVDAAHEAKVGKLSEEALFYLQTRGLSEEQAVRMIVSGFVGPIIRQLPLEYAVELNKLIELEMEGAVG
ncbi:SufD family Fe-S cluster assembly protein [Candidatus Woesearchaeota archaeon]|nr:SufD family Fe-S cluster assembly protein [Candidatus Woesearchaeota archaeon]